MGKSATISPGYLTQYELQRAQRIAANEALMSSLGIRECAESFAATCRGTSSQKKTPRKWTKQVVEGPQRRSSRISDHVPGSYAERKRHAEQRPSDGTEKKRGLRSETRNWGPTVEEYTDEDEKLLGSCDQPWTLYVDGCDSSGKRIYDPVAGKTCHQCRQKTMGHRTSCSHCKLVQGQFCGDCLFMRYGENVVEAKDTYGWMCPPCRGICNCSICRSRRGWTPTGALYSKATQLGHKSVAHYLMATRRKVKAEKTKQDDIATVQKPSLEKAKEDKAGPNSTEEDEKSEVTLAASAATTSTNATSSSDTSANSGPIGGMFLSKLSVAERVRVRPRRESAAKTPRKICAEEVDEEGEYQRSKISRKNVKISADMNIKRESGGHAGCLKQESEDDFASVKSKKAKTEVGKDEGKVLGQTLASDWSKNATSTKILNAGSAQTEVASGTPVRRSARKSKEERVDWTKILGTKTKVKNEREKIKEAKKEEDMVEPLENETDDNDEGEVFAVERIMEWRVVAGKREALIKWEGWGEEHNSWEPEGNINNPSE